MYEPYDMYSRQEFEKVRLGKQRPSCNVCGEKIYDRTAMRSTEGEIVCHECHRNVWTEFEVDDFL